MALDRDRELAGRDGLAVTQPAGRPGERLPAAVRPRLEQEHLGRSPRLPPRPHPHGQDARVVQDDEVVRAKLVQEVAEAAVADGPAAAVVDEQAGAVARLGRGLRDQPGWKVVVEVVGAHRIS